MVSAEWESAAVHSRPGSAAVQPKLVSPHWQRKNPSQIQQQLEDKHAAAAERRTLQQVQKKARQARVQAGRQVHPPTACLTRLVQQGSHRPSPDLGSCHRLVLGLLSGGCHQQFSTSSATAAAMGYPVHADLFVTTIGRIRQFGNLAIVVCILLATSATHVCCCPMVFLYTDGHLGHASGHAQGCIDACSVWCSVAEADARSSGSMLKRCHGAQAVQNVEMERKLAGEQQLQQRQARKAELRNAHLRQIRRKALDESTKVHEVLFINKLQKEDKELTLMQRMQVTHTLPCCMFMCQQAWRTPIQRCCSCRL